MRPFSPTTMLRGYFLALLLVAGAPAALAQPVVTGTVTDAESGAPLPGVNVFTGRPPVGTATNATGQYRLELPAGADSLTFSFIGYERLTVAVGGRRTIDVALSAGARLGDVVVTALGIEREQRELGYAIQSLDAAELPETDAGNLIGALSGRIAGAQVTDASGAPGSGARIVLRGITSLEGGADNQPLFIVDGIPVDNSTSVGAEGFDSRGFSNRGVDLNPNDIESVSVLKGASATALYGLRAANGAIIITTRRGRAGTPRVSVTSSVSSDHVNRFPATQQVYTQGNNGVYNFNEFFCCWGAPLDSVRQANPDVQMYNNFENAYETGFSLDNNVSLSGGTDLITFYASLADLRSEGVLPFSTWGRTSARLNGTLRPSRAVGVSGSLNYVRSGGNRVFADRFNERLIYWAQTRDVTDYINDDGTMIGYYGADINAPNQGTNPLYDARYATYRDNVNRLIGTATLDVTPLPWLFLSYRAGVDTYTDSRFQTTRGPVGVPGENALSTGSLGQTTITSRDLTSTLLATARLPLSADLAAELLVGNDIFDRSSDQASQFGSVLTIPDLYRFSNVRDRTNDYFIRQRRLVGVYGAAKLAYDNALFLEVTGRNDWSSTLPEAERSFFYPSASISYVFSEHMAVPGLSSGRLRLSLAQVGKDTDPYRTSLTYGAPAGFPLAGQTGFTLSSTLGSADLVPERTTSFEAGTELRMLGDRLRFDGSYYNATSADQIVGVPISNATGFTFIILNAGSIRNEGVELSLGAALVQTPAFGWDVQLNFGTNKNTVVSIREGIEQFTLSSQFGYVGSSATLRLIPGQPYGAIYGTTYRRYYAPGEEDDGLTVNEDAPLLIGANGFPSVDPTPRLLGNMTPDWTGGLLNRFRYGPFELSALIDASFGAQKYNQFDNFFSAFGIADYTLNRNDTITFEGVTSDGQPNTQPVWLGQGLGPDGRNYGAGYYRNVYRAATENAVMDASYIKLRNVSLGYALPARLTAPLSVQSARLRFAVSNILLWTPYAYWDPEVTTSGTGNYQGFSGLSHPGVSSYTLTLELGI